MPWPRISPVRKDSKSIALLALFSAMVIILEAYPILGVTDIRTVGFFTLDPTGIPLVIVLLGLGSFYSIITIFIMWISIVYRGKLAGATFKGIAELLTILGIIFAKKITRRRKMGEWSEILVWVAIASLFRSVGMFFAILILSPYLHGVTFELALVDAILYFPWNIVQACINVIGGVLLYRAIPIELKLQAGLGENINRSKSTIESLPHDEIPETMDISEIEPSEESG
jgi:riboflavin transporter FmnP